MFSIYGSLPGAPPAGCVGRKLPGLAAVGNPWQAWWSPGTPEGTPWDPQVALLRNNSGCRCLAADGGLLAGDVLTPVIPPHKVQSLASWLPGRRALLS